MSFFGPVHSKVKVKSFPTAKGGDRAMPLRRKRWIRKRTVLFAIFLGAGLSYWQMQKATRTPEALLVLGGEPKREQFAAQFAQTHPNLPIWVSGGSNPEYAEWVFQEAGIDPDLLHLDYDAVDTVTNFTTIVDKLKARGINHIYLITSDYHMRRAQVIAQVVLGSRNIQFQIVSIPSQKKTEPIQKAVFDGVRAVLWVATGDPGLSLKEEFSSSIAR
jgi:uncharacterized SAM-binding protein YcdF (DUF218 family)